MLVCHLCDGSVAGDYFRNLTRGLTQAGVEVLLADLGRPARPDWLTDMPGARYAALGATGKAAYPLAALRLARLLKSEKVDILHTHLFYSGLIGVISKRFAPGITNIYMRHHTSVVRMLGSRFHIWADRFTAERADHVITVSDAARRYMVEVDEIRRTDIEVVYLGFDFARMSPDAAGRARVRSEFRYAADDTVIGYVGNLAPGKGHLQLLQAMPAIIGEVPGAKLLFVGKGSLPEVEAAAKMMPPGSVTFAGWRNDMASCYSAMDIFVQPSLSEAFSQVLVEAMGAGLPVIATDVGGANEVIDSGRNGVLIPPDDPGRIVREVAALARDPKMKSAIAAEGRESVRIRFSAETMVERHLELYRRWSGA